MGLGLGLGTFRSCRQAEGEDNAEMDGIGKNRLENAFWAIVAHSHSSLELSSHVYGAARPASRILRSLSVTGFQLPQYGATRSVKSQWSGFQLLVMS